MTAKILVTGGAGFIGSHLVEGLLAKGYTVRVMDNLASGRKDWVHPESEFIEADICDANACLRAAEGMDAIFHMAAMSRAGPSLDNIEICTQSNIIGTQNILVASRAKKVGKVVYSGSSTYYGNQPAPHFEYETPSQFLNFYALTKYMGEQYTLMFDNIFRLPAVVLRYFNVYGPRQPQEGAYALVLGIFLKRWLENKPLVIHGEGRQRRDFIHVRDVVRANIMALESDVHGQIFNVGSGTNISIQELADLISKNQVHQQRRPGDAEITLADIRRITAALGWRPEISFDDGLREMMSSVKADMLQLAPL